MLRHHRFQLLLALSLLFAAILPAQAGPRAQTTQFKQFLPMIKTPAAASPFGFDVHYTVSDAVLQYIDVSTAKARTSSGCVWPRSSRP